MNVTLISIVSSACIVGCTLAMAAEPSLHWSGFQNGGYQAPIEPPLATQWSPDLHIGWQSSVDGYGQSSPVIYGDQVYVTSVSGDHKEMFHLAAFDLNDGTKLWQQDFSNPSPKKNTPMTSRAAPTPVADGRGCIVFFEGGVIAAVDRDGETRWQRDLVQEYGAIDARHGLASSVEQDAQRAYVWVERSKSPYILAIDKHTGANTWKVEGTGSNTWASPRLVPTQWGHHLVCSSSGRILGIEPSSGQVLWDFASVANNSSCTPVPVGQNRFLIGASDGRGAENSGAGAEFNGVVEITRSGGSFDASYVWHAERASSSFGSPIVVGDAACIVNRTGVLYTFDIETGERRATLRTQAGQIWATPIAQGDRLYLFGYKGTTSVVSFANGTPQEIAVNRLWASSDDDASSRGGHVLYAAAAAPPALILRRGDAIFAVKSNPEDRDQ